EAEDAAEVILKSLGLENLSERLPNNLSGGEARRLGLARAIAPRPPLLLLDEPFAGLDPDSRRESIAYIEQVINETRTTVLLVTHRTEEAAMLGGPMYSLEGGALSS
ncbi:MAG TPA: nitrate ABC transporter ATP-binding protein, partial [Planctomycetes bacterium]|nr:nitrate ABC transporter ATP-binding protein [Planctomycetota bacterium]